MIAESQIKKHKEDFESAVYKLNRTHNIHCKRDLFFVRHKITNVLKVFSTEQEIINFQNYGK